MDKSPFVFIQKLKRYLDISSEDINQVNESPTPRMQDPDAVSDR